MTAKAIKRPVAKPGKKAAPKKSESTNSRQQAPRDPRLPAAGSTLTRIYKGQELTVKVLADDFEYQGETFKSLSGLARQIVGYQISGPVFFRLTGDSEAK